MIADLRGVHGYGVQCTRHMIYGVRGAENRLGAEMEAAGRTMQAQGVRCKVWRGVSGRLTGRRSRLDRAVQGGVRLVTVLGGADLIVADERGDFRADRRSLNLV